jgi:predicted dehydrogenase
MQWLMGDAPLSVSAFLAHQEATDLEDIADIRVMFPGDRMVRAHLSWRSPVRQTKTALYGDQAMLEIDGDRILLTERSGHSEDLTVEDAPDDSYHSTWFGKVVEDFERAIASGSSGPVASRNHAEARTALKLIEAARQSARSGGSAVILQA